LLFCFNTVVSSLSSYYPSPTLLRLLIAISCCRLSNIILGQEHHPYDRTCSGLSCSAARASANRNFRTGMASPWSVPIGFQTKVRDSLLIWAMECGMDITIVCVYWPGMYWLLPAFLPFAYWRSLVACSTDECSADQGRLGCDALSNFARCCQLSSMWQMLDCSGSTFL
jgi:hypothetical protein